MSDTSRTALSRHSIQAALALRKKSSFEASTTLGRNRTYLDDFLKGRKESVSPTFILKLAEYLDVHRSYLRGKRVWDDDKQIPARGIEARLADYETYASEIREEIENIQRRKGSDKNFNDDDLKEAYERLSTYELIINQTKISAVVRENPELAKQTPNETGWAIPSRFAFELLGARESHLAVFVVVDNSMKDTHGNGFMAGDRVIADLTKTDVRSGGVFAVLHAETVFIRSIAPSSNEPGTLVSCQPLNPLFPSFSVDASDRNQLLGRVMAFIRSL